jgi:hypothetical protein
MAARAMCVFSDKKCCGLAAFFSSPVSHWNAKDQNASYCLRQTKSLVRAGEKARGF